MFKNEQKEPLWKRSIRGIGIMKKLLYLALTAFLASLFSLSPVYAQDTMATLEEIVVTARKREENLQEVPVSISVISADLIQEAGLINPRDIFEAVPGLDYDESHDRVSSNPAIRGVQSSAVSVLRQKVTSFIDGLPLMGSQGYAAADRCGARRGL